MSPKAWRSVLVWLACLLALIFWASVCRAKAGADPVVIQPLPYSPSPGYVRVALGPTESVEVPRAFAEAMDRVIACESGWEPGHVSKTGDRGIPQINPIHFDDMRAVGLNPESEVDLMKYAVVLWQESGLAPWESSKECWQ